MTEDDKLKFKFYEAKNNVSTLLNQLWESPHIKHETFNKLSPQIVELYNWRLNIFKRKINILKNFPEFDVETGFFEMVDFINNLEFLNKEINYDNRMFLEEFNEDLHKLLEIFEITNNF